MLFDEKIAFKKYCFYYECFWLCPMLMKFL